MKKFVLHIILFFVVSVGLLLPIEYYKIRTMRFISQMNGYEVYRAIRNSKQKKKVKRLIIGDSVAQQLYPNELSYDSLVSMGSTATISLAGMYFLLENFVEVNREALPEEVILLITPFSLGCDLEGCTFQYFLKPFPMREYQKYYNEHLTERVRTIPFYWAANLPFIQTTNYSPMLCVPAEQEYASLSQISYDYIQKIDSVANEYGMKFTMIATPIRDDRRDDFEQWKQNIDEKYYEGLNGLLEGYLSTVTFYSSEDYQDDVHFIYSEKPVRISKIPRDYLHILRQEWQN